MKSIGNPWKSNEEVHVSFMLNSCFIHVSKLELSPSPYLLFWQALRQALIALSHGHMQAPAASLGAASQGILVEDVGAQGGDLLQHWAFPD